MHSSSSKSPGANQTRSVRSGPLQQAAQTGGEGDSSDTNKQPWRVDQNTGEEEEDDTKKNQEKKGDNGTKGGGLADDKEREGSGMDWYGR